jgi:hypothetical protein
VPDCVLIIHGLGGSGPGHWQSWLAQRLAHAGVHVAYPQLPDPDAPLLSAWRAALMAELEALPAPPVVAAHSLGSVLWLHATAEAQERLAERVLLVAPPSETASFDAIAEFLPAPFAPAGLDRAAGETRLVCGTDDPYCPEGAHVAYAEPLSLPCDVITGGAHLNVDAGYGAWPAVERWVLEGTAPLTGREAG